MTLLQKINTITFFNLINKLKEILLEISGSTFNPSEHDLDEFLNESDNAFVRNSSLSYSTNETLTGGTWIDGKPIYRKVLIIDNTDEHEAGSYINLDNYITDLDFVLPNQIYLDDDGGILMGNGRLVIFNGKYINFFTDVTGTIDNPVPIRIMTIILEYTKTT